MFQGFTENTIRFMWNIRFNNEKSWFEAHKAEYKAVLERPMQMLAREVYEGFIPECGYLDLMLHVSRIHRDARRLHGRGPYKDHLWFTIREPDREGSDKPAFWFELTPETWSYGMGYYLAKALTMEKLRARIDSNPRPLMKLARELALRKEFVLEGEDYARPKCPPDKPLSEWYNKKTFSLIHEEKVDDAVFSPDLRQRLIQGFTFLLPFYRYFATLDQDVTPR